MSTARGAAVETQPRTTDALIIHDSTAHRHHATHERRNATPPSAGRRGRRPRQRSRGNRRVARGDRIAAANRRSRTGARADGPARGRRARSGDRLAAGSRHALRQHDPGRSAGAFPRRPRDRTAARIDHAMERAGDGRAREPGLRRPRRPHRQLCERRRPVRGRLQPFLPRRRRWSRRPRVLPAAFGARRLRARVPRRPPVRGRPRALSSGDRCGLFRQPGRPPAEQPDRPARAVELSASVADAGLLAVPDRFDGPRADQLDPACALHALSAAPRTGRHERSPRLGRVRRRRDGRARKHERVDARIARTSRQPDLGRQLQPAATRRSGARQRPHHRRARGVVRRRGLARHQAGVGLGLGRLVRARSRRRAREDVRRHRRRSVPDLRREGRTLQPRAFLRPGPGARRRSPPR